MAVASTSQDTLKPNAKSTAPPKEQLYELREDKVKILGQGSFGVALLTRRTSDNKPVVIKKSRGHQASGVSKNEIRVMQDLVHPNIVRIVDHWRTKAANHGVVESSYYIAMEYCNGGSLKDALDHRSRVEKRGFPEEVIQQILAQCAYALYYCHAQHVLHRDLKADNVLLHDGNVKLCDFGLSCSVRSTTDFATTQLGTPHYVPPEVVAKSPYNDRADMWSLGVMVFELMQLTKPFPGSTMHEVFEAIRHDEVPEMNPGYSEDLRKLVRSLLDKNPTKRPSAAQILELKWAKKVLDEAPLPDAAYIEKRKIRQTKAWRRLNVVALRKDTIMYEMVRSTIYVNVRSEPCTKSKANVITQLQFGSVIEEVKRYRDANGVPWHCLVNGYCVCEAENRPLFEEIPEWRVVRPGARVTPEPQADLDEQPDSQQAESKVNRALVQLVSETVTPDEVAAKGAAVKLRQLLAALMPQKLIDEILLRHAQEATPSDDAAWTIYACETLKANTIPLSYVRSLRAIGIADPTPLPEPACLTQDSHLDNWDGFTTVPEGSTIS